MTSTGHADLKIRSEVKMIFVDETSEKFFARFALSGKLAKFWGPCLKWSVVRSLSGNLKNRVAPM